MKYVTTALMVTGINSIPFQSLAISSRKEAGSAIGGGKQNANGAEGKQPSGAT